MTEKMFRMRSTRLLIPVFLLIVAGMTACGVRPYDYFAPYFQTRAAAHQATPTPTSSLSMVPTFTSLPSASPTPTLTPTAYLISIQSTTPTSGVTPYVDVTPLEGTAEVTLDNRTGNTLVVDLEGEASFGYELAPTGMLRVLIPAGTYRYWLVLPGRQTLRGSKTFTAGPQSWVFYRTPGVLESPTPRWPQHSP